MDLARRGVETRFVEATPLGNVTVEDVERVVDKKTKLVSLASVHFQTGWRLDVDRIGRFLRKRGVLFCLDGIQSFGALRTSMKFVDFAAADAHKWLLGPLGTAIFYVRREHFERFHPPLVGWNNASSPNFIAQESLAFKRDARRYEPGSLNLAGIVGLRAALQLIHEYGIEPIEARVLALAEWAIACAAKAGFSVLGAAEGKGSQGLFHSWRKAGMSRKCTRNWRWRRWLLLSAIAGTGDNACACRRISTTLKKRSRGCLRKFSAVGIFNATH